MKKANYIVFDVETGGFKPTENPITQIALVAVNQQFEEINRYETFVKNYDDLILTKGALKATGFTPQEIEKKGIEKKEMVKNLIAFFQSAMPNKRPENRPILIGHNVQFDLGFLGYAFESEKKNYLDYCGKNSIDTMMLGKMLWMEKESLKLGECCNRVGIKLENAHSAMPDVLATLDLFKWFVTKLRNKGEVSGIVGTDAKVKQRKYFNF